MTKITRESLGWKWYWAVRFGWIKNNDYARWKAYDEKFKNEKYEFNKKDRYDKTD